MSLKATEGADTARSPPSAPSVRLRLSPPSDGGELRFDQLSPGALMPRWTRTPPLVSVPSRIGAATASHPDENGFTYGVLYQRQLERAARLRRDAAHLRVPV